MLWLEGNGEDLAELHSAFADLDNKQWSGVCQDPSCPELESQVIAKFVKHGVLHSARLLRIKENALLNSSSGLMGYWRPGAPPSVLSHKPTTLTRAELSCYASLLMLFLSSPFLSAKGVWSSQNTPLSSLFGKEQRCPEILHRAGVCVKCLPANSQKMLLGTAAFNTTAQDYLLGSGLSGFQGCARARTQG